MSSLEKERRFNCKYEDCAYREGSHLYFQKYQYLKQHYDKVHKEKIYPCKICSKKFATTTLLKSHVSYCGKEFTCSCGMKYKSNESLLTHAKRKNHPLGPIPRNNNVSIQRCLSTQSHAPLPVNLPHGSTFFLVHSDKPLSDGLFKSQTVTDRAQACAMHIMAAVALSELSTTIPESQPIERKEVSTQTENDVSPYQWLNSVPITEPVSSESKIHDSGTQTEAIELDTVLNPYSPQSPGSPWLGLSAETQTVDEDIVLRPLNLCNIQTQTLWNQISDDDTTELAHTETQTLLSSFFIDDSNMTTECQSERTKICLVKQNSEDAGTDPMEIFDWKNTYKSNRC